MNYCQNCGHKCHCNGFCFQNYDKDNEIICCTHCRHKEVEQKTTSPEDLFNGA